MSASDPGEADDDLLSRVSALAFVGDPTTGRALRVIGAVESITGHSAVDSITGLFRLESIVLPEDLPVLVGGLDLQLGASQLKEYRYRRPDGGVGWLLHVTRIFAYGAAPRIAGLLIDITDQRRTESAAGISAVQLRESLERLDVLAVALDLKGHVTFCNARVLECTGYREDEVMGSDWFARFVPGDAGVRAAFDEVLARGEVDPNYEGEIITRTGDRLTVRWTNTIIYDLEGKALGTYSIGQDVTEMRRTERALAASEARYRQLFETMQDAFVLIDMRGSAEDCRFIEVNRAFARFIDEPPANLMGRSVREVFAGSTDVLFDRLQRVALNGESVSFELPWLETHRVLEIAAFRLTPNQVAALMVDVTERKRLQAQLEQASKLESIGRLAGGIAHDFNNLLTAILGGAQLALLHLPERHPARAEIDSVVFASERAGRLTGQLLTFARRRMTVRRTVDLGELVAASGELVRRLLTENIEVIIHLASDLWRVHVDPGQLEQVVLNLALNARDAMPNGGTLTFETANVTLNASYQALHPEVAPGDYVLLTASDTGEGMPQAIQAHVFEPFFTTKGSAGTGLGLATCHGVVKQHGGHIWLYSEPGHGTTFKVYLPRTQVEDAPIIQPEQVASLTGNETLLLVEDEPLILDNAFKGLRGYGYQVLAARDAEQALLIASALQGDIHALITDMVMPGMNGCALAERMLELRPALRVLYVSGYTENTIAHQGVLDPNIAFLEKPYAPDQLARRVRELLNAPARSA